MMKKRTKKAVKKAVKAKKTKKLTCEACGLVLSVDSECGCVGAHEIYCCGDAMKVKK